MGNRNPAIVSAQVKQTSFLNIKLAKFATYFAQKKENKGKKVFYPSNQLLKIGKGEAGNGHKKCVRLNQMLHTPNNLKHTVSI